MVNQCLAIGPAAAIQGDGALRTIMRKGGNTSQFDTCDIEKHVGKLLLDPPTIAALLQNEDGNILANDKLRSRLQFFERYPKKADFDRMTRITDRASATPRTLGNVMLMATRWYYTKVKRAHGQSVPYIANEATPFITALANSTSDAGIVQANRLVAWACRSRAFPDPLFPAIAYELTQFASHGTDSIAQPIKQCVQVANQFRRDLVHSYGPPTGVGDIVDLPTLNKDMQRQQFTVLFFWEETCRKCISQFRAVNDLQKEMAPHSVGVYGVRKLPFDVKTERAARSARLRAHATWPNRAIGYPQFALLNRNGSTPLMMIVDQKREIVWMKTGIDVGLARTRLKLAALLTKKPG